ncbi:hypothetical protein [Methanococcoides methylutens]|uniref:hypothetical protein n=1 Tax=Methanococcoides methylutens TaxID=2226 RepID=UPI001AEF38D9|nr:hypothetical protein [Methanococcoides methylutens]
MNAGLSGANSGAGLIVSFIGGESLISDAASATLAIQNINIVSVIIVTGRIRTNPDCSRLLENSKGTYIVG